MPYQMLVRGTLHSAPEQAWRGETFPEARDQARHWLNERGKPGEAVAEIWEEERTWPRLTLRVDARGFIHEDAGSDKDGVRVVWDHLREIAAKVTPGRYDFDRKEYHFAVDGVYTVAVTSEFLRETADLPGVLKAGVPLERIRNTGTEHTLVLTSGGIQTRPNQA